MKNELNLIYILLFSWLLEDDRTPEINPVRSTPETRGDTLKWAKAKAKRLRGRERRQKVTDLAAIENEIEL